MSKDDFYTGRADRAGKLYIASIFETVDGETNAFHAGTWSTFIRLQGCRVGCTYCDTKYSWPINKSGKYMTPAEIVTAVQRADARKVTITGGEPMEQWGEAMEELLFMLMRAKYDISMETAGTENLFPLTCHAADVNLIVDYKMPSALAVRPMVMENFPLLQTSDVVKIVTSLEEMALIPDIVGNLRHKWRCYARIVFSPLWQESNQLSAFLDAARRLSFSKLNVGLSLQTHKFIWPHNVRDEEGASVI